MHFNNFEMYKGFEEFVGGTVRHWLKVGDKDAHT